MSTWNESTGPENDVVISSRVRLARNISGFPFTHIGGENTQKAVYDAVHDASSDLIKNLGLTWVDLRKTTAIDRRCFVEKHLMSPEMTDVKRVGGLILNGDESLSVMVNEEDHLRIQSILPGLQLETAYKMCDDFEEKLGEKVNYAFDEKLGYLTSCPTNLGTGMRVSAMMHLPALVQSGVIKRILEACSKMGVSVRGVYGENSEAEGNIFQISNQVTLGHSEEEITENMAHIIRQIIEKERNVRMRLMNGNKILFEDKIYRAYGILANARSISRAETMNLMSLVRLGIDMGVIDFIDPKNINILLVEIQPGCIQKKYGRELTPQERDEIRAGLCRKILERETI